MITPEQLVAHTKFDHSRYVAKISKILALKTGYSAEEACIIEQAALYHDVGKTDVPPHILNKPGKLTPKEFEVVKTHTENGYEKIMGVIDVLKIASEVAREHHERLDGSGYRKMIGSEISSYAKLIAVVDVFDALISKRPYKKGWDTSNVIKYLIEYNNHFDNQIVMCLVSILNEVLLVYKENDILGA